MLSPMLNIKMATPTRSTSSGSTVSLNMRRMAQPTLQFWLQQHEAQHKQQEVQQGGGEDMLDVEVEVDGQQQGFEVQQGGGEEFMWADDE